MAADFDEEITPTYKGKQRFNRKGVPLLPPEEVCSAPRHTILLRLYHYQCMLEVAAAMQARVRAITEIVAELQRGVKEGRDVNLNAIKRDVCPRRSPVSVL